MGQPKVKKNKSGTQNDSIQQQREKERLKYHRKGDGGLISDKTVETMKKKK